MAYKDRERQRNNRRAVDLINRESGETAYRDKIRLSDARDKGLCLSCKARPSRENKTECERCSTRKRLRNKTEYSFIRKTILARYGGTCRCCGESEPKFLSVDHIDGGGRKHRESTSGTGGTVFYRWIVRNGFPTYLQILCHNCNMAKGMYGVCPHQEKTERPKPDRIVSVPRQTIP